MVEARGSVELKRCAELSERKATRASRYSASDTDPSAVGEPQLPGPPGLSVLAREDLPQSVLKPGSHKSATEKHQEN